MKLAFLKQASELGAEQLEPPLTAAQAAELDRRLAEHEAAPDDVEPWSEVRAAVILAGRANA